MTTPSGIEITATSDKVEKPFLTKLSTYVKYFLSSAATLTYLCYILWGIWTHEAVLPGPYVVHFVIFCFCLTLVAYLEGLKNAILNVEHLDEDKMRESHPRAYRIMKEVKQGNNMERFLMGRQFFTVFVMTLMAQVTSFPEISHLSVNEVVWFIFIETGLPGALIVTTIASLQPQLLSAKDPWKFMDLYGSYSTMQLIYGLQWTGICTHFAWMLIGILRRTAFISPLQPLGHDQVMTTQEKVFDIVRYVVSFFVVMGYCLLLCYGMLTGEALLPLPAVLVFFVFIGSICCLSLLEGTQVAILVEVNKDPEPYKVSHPRAYALMKRVTHEKNVRRFLIGRQFLVIFVVFLINQCTIFPDIQHFGIPFGVWYFFVSLGFPTAINCLCFGQLPCELLANQDPYMFMNRYGPRTVVEICLFTEMTGVAHFCGVDLGICTY
jgi:hypothetical protein